MVARPALVTAIEAGEAADEDAARWAALERRDPEADGRFVYSVRTTGVYCRPSCRARRANPGNVAFHETCEAAEEAGFRPCRRCRPDEPSRRERQAEAVARACRLIERAEGVPPLADLARAAGMSAFHFHRVFKALTGVTPAAFADARRGARVADGLRTAGSVTEAVYGAGFNAASRFYAGAGARLGMTPRAYREGGVGTVIEFSTAPCYLGTVLVAATGRGLCAILLGDGPEALERDLRQRFPKADIRPAEAPFGTLVAQVVRFVEAPAQGLDLPLDIGGTAFQRRVWEALRTIPPGTTASYAEIARAIGAPGAVRAVAQACGANGLAVAIPCHRVVRSDGALSGYRFGVERKRRLLAREDGAE
ncbi:AraC family transcriptional regulator of adaptative response/methylated-DNA-[protein]-cysteine methyltransferase [Methylobacterium sp. BE186]|uniref:bifunctional DNA-binding transcriptional regulator/O6-methylguanine-DNA methyltransferase Ada n=1 Tax=Methylobacterium sp. BE186 TaxID=2817715 RepID=UPI002854925D|nr:bifunctional DNA-binding transcriptional regulator/O6-methylguanine-DNA methyltransferase Ada [Methylobacterium sp. BE186]MDR7040156.1 AraC family transcriptional regulator of adaptative response/methylated-DNA-[protein]-cysteine methyltransferase [Methylobacterium sp. BE186]